MKKHRKGEMKIKIMLLALISAAIISADNSGLVFESIPRDMIGRGGLCVVIGKSCDIKPVINLLADGPWKIHWLDSNSPAVEDARRFLQERGLYGCITVEHWNKDYLPHADNLANMIIFRDRDTNIAQKEFMRALSPGGSAFIAGDGGFERLDKPHFQATGVWTHGSTPGPDGFTASRDACFSVPNAFQWISGPSYPLWGHRKLQTQAILSAGGRIFIITGNVPERIKKGDEGPFLVARDAFSGVVLWSRAWEGPTSGAQWGANKAIAASAERVYGILENRVAVFDAANGQKIDEYVPGESTLADRVKGSLKWPEKWRLFAPMERDDDILSEETLSSYPEKIEVGKTVFYGNDVTVEGTIYDFPEMLKHETAGKTAYVFLKFESPKNQTVTLGMGADWWMQAWLNGHIIHDTTETSNVYHPFSIWNHTINVDIQKGENILAVRFIRGGGSELALGGPDQLRAVLPPPDSRNAKLLLSGELLVVQSAEGLTAFNSNLGEKLWHYGADTPVGVLLCSERIFFLAGSREQDGRWLHELIALELERGAEIWRQPVESRYGHRSSALLRLHSAGDKTVTLLERNIIRVLSAEDGRELWRHKTEGEARANHDSRQFGHFVANDTLWIRHTRAQDGREAPEQWIQKDLLTGNVKRELEVTGEIGVRHVYNKIGCQPLTATQRFVIDARLSTMWDIETGQRAGFKFARGGCLVGMVPANGMAYVPPNACGCLLEQVRGYLALVNSGDSGLSEITPGELEVGPAYGRNMVPEEETDFISWPMYRRDGRRSAYYPGTLFPGFKEMWKTKIELKSVSENVDWQLIFGRPLTPPVVGYGVVIVAEPQSHQVIALDKHTGVEMWRFTAGGRITIPPALYRGMAILGAHDGYVYSLCLTDGKLAWRKRVAPSNRRIMAYGQIESAWPVSGGVLVHQGLVFAAAGRAPDAGGGLVVHALEPATGKLHWSRRIKDAWHGSCEPLIADGQNVYLMNKRLEVKNGEISTVRGREDRLQGGSAGLMEISWIGNQRALRKNQSTWRWKRSSGQILTFTEDSGFAFKMDGGERIASNPETDGGGLIVARPDDAGEPLWSLEIPAPYQVQAMLTTADKLFVAGPKDRFNPEGEGFLRSISFEDGSALKTVALPAVPVHDGIAAAGGKIFTVLQDGSIICWEPD